MDVSISSTEGAEMAHLYQREKCLIEILHYNKLFNHHLTLVPPAKAPPMLL